VKPAFEDAMRERACVLAATAPILMVTKNTQVQKCRKQQSAIGIIAL
jgi:hypothetical protein